MSDHSAGGKSADTSRTERVAHVGAVIGALYAVAHALDEDNATEGLKAWIKARELFQLAEDAVVREVETIGERVRSREALHGENSQTAEVDQLLDDVTFNG